MPTKRKNSCFEKWMSSRTTKTLADAKKATASTAKCERASNQNQTLDSSIPDKSSVISKGADLGQKYSTRQKSDVATKRAIPAE